MIMMASKVRDLREYILSGQVILVKLGFESDSAFKSSFAIQSTLISAIRKPKGNTRNYSKSCTNKPFKAVFSRWLQLPKRSNQVFVMV